MTVVDVSTADNGARVEVRAGDAIVLRLPDNPTTGYRWQLLPVDGDILVLDDEGYLPSGAGVGSGGTATWRLRAVREGTTVVAATRWRPWEGEASVIDRYSISVQVAG